jgi:hypothetical protein
MKLAMVALSLVVAGAAAGLVGIRAADGAIVVDQQLRRLVDAASPAPDNEVTYVTSKPPGGGPIIREAFLGRY